MGWCYKYEKSSLESSVTIELLDIRVMRRATYIVTKPQTRNGLKSYNS